MQHQKSAARATAASTAQEPLVSVILLNWNGKRFVDPFMKSYLQQTYPHDRLELVFTDNGSVDGSLEYFKETYGDKVNHVVSANGKNYGYAGGNNLGMEKTTGDFVLLCNNDLELDKDLIKNLVEAAQKHHADITSAKLMYLNRPGYVNNAGSELLPNSDWPIREIGIDQKDSSEYDHDREITAVCGACILIRRDFLETVGMFDKTFFLYFEDGDLSWRGQKAGKRYWLAAKAIALHFHTGTNVEGSPKFNHFVGRNRILILAKNAKFRVLARGLAKTLRDHFLVRVKHGWDSLFHRYSRRQAWREFWLSQKMLWATFLLLPYAFCKRWGIIKEETL